MACVPLLHCNVPVGVLSLAASGRGDLEGKLDLLRLLASALAPYAGLLEYTTRTAEIQRLLNEIITPIAAQLAQQTSSQLARLGCSIEEDPAASSAAPASAAGPSLDGSSYYSDKARRNNGCCISSPTTIRIGSAAMLPLSAALPSHHHDPQHLLLEMASSNSAAGAAYAAYSAAAAAAGQNGTSASATAGASKQQQRGRRHQQDTAGSASPPGQLAPAFLPALPPPSGPAAAGSQPAAAHHHQHQQHALAAPASGWSLGGRPNANPGPAPSAATGVGPLAPPPGGAAASSAVASVLDALDSDSICGFSGELESMDWGDFLFNLVSMCIVYAYFSKAAVASESLVAILLCMGVAAFDIVLLLLRWLWLEQYIAYGSFVAHFFQLYRTIVLPVANTWMGWSLLTKMDLTPSYGVLALLGLLLLVFLVLGLQVRFFLHAPLQLASVLFAAGSTGDICSLISADVSSLNCIGTVSALQLSLGLALPSAIVWLLEAKGRSGRAFMPHVQAKRWLLHH